MFEIEDGVVISAAEHAANIVEGRGKTEYIGHTKVISVRLPALLLAELQGLAHKSGKTRNATIATLLEVGMEEVKARLSQETLDELDEITSEHFGDLLEESKKC